MNYILCSGYTVKAENRDNKVYLRYKSLMYIRILLDILRLICSGLFLSSEFGRSARYFLNHSHRNIIPYNPSYGIFFINVLSLRKLDSLRTTAMEYFLYSGSSCKDKQTLPCTIFLYHRKTSYTYLPAKERCIMIHQKLHIRTIFILVPRTQFNVTVLMACIPCMWFHL